MVQILWAEDSLQDRQLIREALHDLPQRPKVTFVADGMQLLERAAQDRPNLVVLDLQMPGLDGLEALKRLRADPSTRRQTVVVFTSSDRPDEVDACRSLGVRDCVQKPFDFASFVSAVQRVVGPVEVPV
jgi:CheY-like chemotaxis protein